MCSLSCPDFDFKNDYGYPFDRPHGFKVGVLNEGLPLNPLKLPPHGTSDAQAINHILKWPALLGQPTEGTLRNAAEIA
jgi:hypothetical protein